MERKCIYCGKPLADDHGVEYTNGDFAHNECWGEIIDGATPLEDEEIVN